ncbi:hypothetical protein DFLDMN_006368 (plasmid) [Cupriavidus sp. H19C3]
MYVDKLYSDVALRRILANGVAANATAEWPWLPVFSREWPAARRRGLRANWGGMFLYTFDEMDVSEVGIEGYIVDNPFFDFGEIWGNGVAVGAHLSDLVSMHFARLTRRRLGKAGWQFEDYDTEAGTIFRISSVLSPANGDALGKALAVALQQADVAHLCLACQAGAYLDGLKDFAELPARPIAGRPGSNSER